MRLLLSVCILVVAQAAFAFDYLLIFEQTCKYENKAFPCESSNEQETIRQQPNGKWVGVRSDGSIFDLRTMKNDDHVLVLEYPVLWSGASVIHLMKRTGRFYWSEISYSEALKSDDGRVNIGRFELNPQR